MDGLDSRFPAWGTKDFIISKMKLFGRSGIGMIVFVSETEAERRLCNMQSGIVAQLQFLKLLPADILNKLVLVYKPIGIMRSQLLPSIIKSYERIVATTGRSDITILCNADMAPQDVGAVLRTGYEGLFLTANQWNSYSGILDSLYQGAL